jgi:hypothetical protein
MSIEVSNPAPGELIINAPQEQIDQLIKQIKGEGEQGITVNCGGCNGSCGKSQPLPVLNDQQMYEDVSVFGKKPKASEDSKLVLNRGGIPTPRMDWNSMSAFKPVKAD